MLYSNLITRPLWISLIVQKVSFAIIACKFYLTEESFLLWRPENALRTFFLAPLQMQVNNYKLPSRSLRYMTCIAYCNARFRVVEETVVDLHMELSMSAEQEATNRSWRQKKNLQCSNALHAQMLPLSIPKCVCATSVEKLEWSVHIKHKLAHPRQGTKFDTYACITKTHHQYDCCIATCTCIIYTLHGVYTMSLLPEYLVKSSVHTAWSQTM